MRKFNKTMQNYKSFLFAGSNLVSDHRHRVAKVKWPFVLLPPSNEDELEEMAGQTMHA
jgi:hypothetical protein